MNENIRTLVFVAVAAVLGIISWGTLPSSTKPNDNNQKGQRLFSKLDPENARKLEITTLDELSGEPSSFVVAMVNENWVLPSHSNYPADAETQLRDAATSLIAVEVLDVASQIREDHIRFGVISPTDKNAASQAAASKDEKEKNGVGTLVVLSDEKGKELARMVVGKEVAKSPGQRFVRYTEGETLPDTVCVVKLDLSKLPAEFSKWIEPDLLKVSPLDFTKVTLKDYSVVELPNSQGRTVAQLDLRMDAMVSVSDKPNSWQLERLQGYQKRRPVDLSLGDQEELNQTRLDELRTALDELKIEDVVPKPAGMGSQLKVNAKFAEDEETLRSLQSRGFYVQSASADDFEIFSSNGEVLIDTKDGVRYICRFGGVVEGAKGIQKGSGGEKLNRYLLVTAQLSEETLAKPVLLPEESPSKPDEEKVEGKEPVEKEPTAKEPAAKEPRPELELIQKENKRRLDEYDNRLKAARQKVNDLNARFADWYYIISEDVYKKVHLGRSDMIKDSAVAKSLGSGVDAFRKLEQDGLKKSPPPGARGGAGGPGGLPPGFEGQFPPM